jgi:hypothetical protein
MQCIFQGIGQTSKRGNDVPPSHFSVVGKINIISVHNNFICDVPLFSNVRYLPILHNKAKHAKILVFLSPMSAILFPEQSGDVTGAVIGP